jgi:hypothetical protein
MVEAEGWLTQRRQGQGITTAAIKITVGLMIVVGFHCCAVMAASHALCLAPMKSTTDRHAWAERFSLLSLIVVFNYCHRIVTPVWSFFNNIKT